MDIRDKQIYLSKQIIDSGYDPEQFQDYIEKYKGLNLQLYTMDQLINIVQSFKKSGRDSEIVKEETSQIEEKEILQKNQNVEQNKPTQIQDKLNESELVQLKQQEFQKKNLNTCNSSTKVYHQFLPKTVFSSLYKRVYGNKQKIVVKIRSYTKNQDDSLFRSSYVAYQIETINTNWSVKRRFKDFQWLNIKLSQLFPGLPIPPIPKKTTVRYFDDKHLEDRMIIFQKFINRLIHIPQICSQQILEEFLSVEKAQQFNTCKERFQVKLDNRGNKIVSLKGDEVINRSRFAVQPKQFDFHHQSQILLNRLNFQISSLQKALKLATDRSFQLSSTFRQVQQHFSSKPQINGSSSYQILGDFINQLGYKLDSQLSFIRNNIQNYCVYEQKYIGNLVQNMTKINKQQYQMLSKYKNMSMAQELESQENYMQNKTFCQYLQTKQLYRIKLSFLMQEIERYQKEDLLQLAKDWTQSLKNYMGGVRDLMLSGADQLTKAICVSQGKKLIQVQYISSKRPSKQPKQMSIA